MIFGGTPFAHIHVVLSVLGILAGFVVMFGLLFAMRLDAWTAVFLLATLLTTVTGFLFPFHKFLPSHGVGIVSLIVLALAIPARYVFRLSGGWRRTYAIAATIALYLNVFVLIGQLFAKVPALKALAPTQSEPPFLLTQLGVMALHRAGYFRNEEFPGRATPSGLN